MSLMTLNRKYVPLEVTLQIYNFVEQPQQTLISLHFINSSKQTELKRKNPQAHPHLTELQLDQSLLVDSRLQYLNTVASTVLTAYNSPTINDTTVVVVVETL